MLLMLITCLQNFEAKDISQKGIKGASESSHVALLKSRGFLDLCLHSLNGPQNAGVAMCVSKEYLLQSALTELNVVFK